MQETAERRDFSRLPGAERRGLIERRGGGSRVGIMGKVMEKMLKKNSSHDNLYIK